MMVTMLDKTYSLYILIIPASLSDSQHNKYYVGITSRSPQIR